jgi:hypothetical protein
VTDDAVHVLVDARQSFEHVLGKIPFIGTYISTSEVSIPKLDGRVPFTLHEASELCGYLRGR